MTGLRWRRLHQCRAWRIATSSLPNADLEGPKSLTEKLEQLFGGATSADVRLALIAFVP
jgi:hypothetical protein